MSKRYIHIMWDGIFDSHNDPNYEKPMDLDQIVRVMNDTDNQIKVWQKKYDEMKAKYERCKNGKEEKN